MEYKKIAVILIAAIIAICTYFLRLTITAKNNKALISQELEVEMYTKKNCIFCLKAEKFFYDHDMSFASYDITKDWSFKEEASERSGVPLDKLTFPQIFINNIYIGGYSELMQAYYSGKIQEIAKN